MDSVKIQVKFKKGDYSDALYLPLEQYQNMSPEALESLKEERYQTWLTFVEEQRNKPQGEPEKVEVSLEEAEKILLDQGYILKSE